MKTAELAALVAVIPTFCLVDRKAGDACAAGLTLSSREIHFHTSTPVFLRVKRFRLSSNRAEKLVSPGKMSVHEARAAAEAAGRCLELILG